MSTHFYKYITQQRVVLFAFITLGTIFLYRSSHGIPVEIHQKAPFQKYWVWLDDKTGMEKKHFNQKSIHFHIRVNEKYPRALVSWKLKRQDYHSGNVYTHEGFDILLEDIGLCKKVVHIDEIGRMTRETSFYKNKYGMCGKEGKVKNY